MAKYLRRWEGGEVLRLENGLRAYVISKVIRGRRFRFSTRCSSLNEARTVLRRFIADPDGFRLVAAPPPEPRKPLRLDEALISEFIVWSRGKRNSARWIREQERTLHALAKTLPPGHDQPLGQIDLRELKLPVLLPLIAGQPHKIAIVKALYAWLRKVEHRIALSEDPTHGALTVPQRRPGNRRKADKAVPRSVVEAVLAKLAEHWPKQAARLALQRLLGCHVTELRRFACSGRVDPYSGPQSGARGVLVVPQHKHGDEHRVALDAVGVMLARQVLSYGPFGLTRYSATVREACEALCLVEPFAPGQMRHSVATWLVNDGADLAAVAAFLGHRSTETTRRFYARFATPANPGLERS